MRKFLSFTLGVIFIALPVYAEEAEYGSIYLGGLARDVTWPYNDFDEHNTMVCNLDGPDAFMTVRSGPGRAYEKVRSFNRLAILVVDVSQRQRNWVKVISGLRTHTVDGVSQDYKELPVEGWAHDAYLCSFMD